MGTKDDVKNKFKELDRNHDGKLSFDEMSGLLRKGRHDISDEELQLLWNAIDRDGNGEVDFDEYVDFVFAPYTTGEVDWPEVKKTFIKFAHKDEKLDGREFIKMCQMCELFDKEFSKEAADICYTKVTGGNHDGISFKQFRS